MEFLIIQRIAIRAEKEGLNKENIEEKIEKDDYLIELNDDEITEKFD